MKKLLTLTLLLIFSLSVSVALAAPPTQDETGEEYIVQAGDWLSKLAEKYYGDVLAYPLIVESTNAKAAADDSFAVIDNPDLIEVGQKLWIDTSVENAMDGEMTTEETSSEEMTAEGTMTDTMMMTSTEEMAEGEMKMAAAETSVVDLTLTGVLADRDAEISGLDWYGDNLIFLPQYPNFSTDGGDGFAYALPQADLISAIDNAAELAPTPIPFVAPGLQDSIAGFEGYEAIAFAGDNNLFVTIEAENEDGTMRGYLVSGTIEPDLSAITLNTDSLTEISAQSNVGNMSDESLLVVDNGVASFYEANGAGVNPNPVANLFDSSGAAVGSVPLANIEYRVTDVTDLDANNRFWAINYFFPGDEDLLPTSDPIAEAYGQGPTHSNNEGVERLIELQYSDSGITLADTAPIQLELLAEDLRNWEGIVRLGDRGFILATDKYPSTILAFVPYAPEN